MHFHHPWWSDVGRYDSRARIVRDNPIAFPPSRQLLLHCSTFRRPCRSPGGQKEEVELRREQQPRATHDCMDAGGRTASGTAVEEQLPGGRSRPSMVFAAPAHLTSMDGGNAKGLSGTILAMYIGPLSRSRASRHFPHPCGSDSQCSHPTYTTKLKGGLQPPVNLVAEREGFEPSVRY